MQDRLEQLKAEYEKSKQEILDSMTKEERIDLNEPIRQVDKLQEFTANGQRYIIRDSLTITRFEQFEKVQVRVAYGIDFKSMFTNINKAYDLLNNAKPADASVLLHNMMNGIKNKLDGRESEVLELCSLFICRPDEDITVYDKTVMRDKINDWKTEGIAMDSFFSLAFSLVSDFTSVYNQILANTSTTLNS